MVATLLQFNFCYLLRLIINSGVHEALTDVHVQHIGSQTFF